MYYSQQLEKTPCLSTVSAHPSIHTSITFLWIQVCMFFQYIVLGRLIGSPHVTTAMAKSWTILTGKASEVSGEVCLPHSASPIFLLAILSRHPSNGRRVNFQKKQNVLELCQLNGPRISTILALSPLNVCNLYSTAFIFL